MSKQLRKSTIEMVEKLDKLQFSEPVTHTYNPLNYARLPHEKYLELYAQGKKKVLFMGMNPGPFGMAQTGVPFGEVEAVEKWMGINEEVGQPNIVHPKRPIEGFACSKSEVSGRRLWGLFSRKFPDAKDFFKDHYVTNYCPLVWMADTGRNITPDKINKQQIKAVELACDAFLVKLIEEISPDFVIGIGAYAEKKLTNVLKKNSLGNDITIGKILHPSPASPLANSGWEEIAERQLLELGVW